MKLLCLAASVLIFCPLIQGAESPCPVKQEKSAGALVMVEMRWVRALDQRDVKMLGCILGSEFTDSGVYGRIRDRETVLGELPHHPDIKQHFRDLKATVAGDTGIVRGINHVAMPNGQSVDVRFTDTFVHRDGAWQAVAAQETLIRQKEKPLSAKDKDLDFEITPQELKKKMDAGEKLVVLDVREALEYEAAHVEGTKQIPMGDVPSRAHQELDPEQHIVVMCHHGVRSASVAMWLQQQGFEHVQSLQGGIDRWAREIDPKVATY